MNADPDDAKQRERDAEREEWLRMKAEADREEQATAARIARDMKLGAARLELELRRRARALSPELSGLDDDDDDVADAENPDPVASEWGDQHLARFGGELVTVLLLASREAVRLGRTEFGLDAVLLGFLASSEGTELCRKGLPPSLGDGDPVEAARAAVEEVVQGIWNPAGRPGPPPLDKPLRLLLEAVAAERARLGQDEAAPGHLLLALTSDEFTTGSGGGGAKALNALTALGVDPGQLRAAALESLGAQRDS